MINIGYDIEPTQNAEMKHLTFLMCLVLNCWPLAFEGYIGGMQLDFTLPRQEEADWSLAGVGGGDTARIIVDLQTTRCYLSLLESRMNCCNLWVNRVRTSCIIHIPIQQSFFSHLSSMSNILSDHFARGSLCPWAQMNVCVKFEGISPRNSFLKEFLTRQKSYVCATVTPNLTGSSLSSSETCFLHHWYLSLKYCAHWSAMARWTTWHNRRVKINKSITDNSP